MVNDFLNILFPQACLALFVLIELVMAMFVPKEKYYIARPISAIGLSLAIVLLSTVQAEPQYFGFSNSIMSDNYTLLFHFIILLCGFFVVLLMKNLTESMKEKAFILQALLLTAVFGAMCVVNANDFLTLLISSGRLCNPNENLIKGGSPNTWSR